MSARKRLCWRALSKSPAARYFAVLSPSKATVADNDNTSRIEYRREPERRHERIDGEEFYVSIHFLN